VRRLHCGRHPGRQHTINFFYDGDGNLKCETTAAQCDSSAINKLAWTSFNRPSSITHEGATNIAYSYDPEHNRIEMNAPRALTKYLSDPASGVLSEHPPSRCALRGTGMGPSVMPYVDRDYIMADGKMVAIVVTQNSATTSVYYPVLDHLGSVSVIVDGNRILPNGNANPNYGQAIDRYSYDAWGEARDPSQWSPRNCSDGPQPPFTRGFTGQEHIPNGVCLINFNARVYDPAIGRFLSADPTVEAPYNPQDLNRYSYVLNNPLGFTDPSGLCFLGCFWNNSIFRDIAAFIVVAVFQQWEVLPEIGLELGFVTSSASLATVVNAGILGGMSGAIITGNLKGAALGALQAGMFAEAGNLTEAIPATETIARDASTLVTHSLVGGIVSVAGGGKFGSGFIAAGFASQFEPGPPQNWEQAAFGATEAAVAGGFGSMLGGGKFENGAVTGAFGYLFNCTLHPGTCTQGEVRQEGVQCINTASSACYSNLIADAAEVGLIPYNPNSMLGDFLRVDIYSSLSGAATALGVVSKPVIDAIFRLGSLAVQLSTADPELETIPELPSSTQASPEAAPQPSPAPQTSTEPINQFPNYLEPNLGNSNPWTPDDN
jgi:RHS repeat-associated protein